MCVLIKKSADRTVYAPKGRVTQQISSARGHLGTALTRLIYKHDPTFRSSNLLPGGGLYSLLKRTESDVLNLHWVNLEALSLSALGKIPAIWTLHDMWAFCGTEHYTDTERYKEGYLPREKNSGDPGFDLDRYVWKRKRALWRNPQWVVCPSRWLAQCVRESALMHTWPVHVIPNVLETDTYKPLDKKTCRSILNLPPDQPIIGFGAIGDVDEPRKGLDLLIQALRLLGASGWKGLAVVVGGTAPKTPVDRGVPIRYLGRLNDDVTMAVFYNAVDAVIVPSRQENLPQAATEAQACGCPVVGFNCTGMADAVSHRVTGYLAEPYCPEDLVAGIHWALNAGRSAEFRHNCRQRAESLWAPDVIIPQYTALYEEFVRTRSISPISRLVTTTAA